MRRGWERKLFAVFFDIGQHGVCPDGVAFFRKVQVVPADAGEQFAGGVQKAPVDVGVSGAGQLALGQNGVDAVVVLAQLVLGACAARENAQQEDVGVREPDQQVFNGTQNSHGRFFRGFPSFEITGIVGADHDDAEFGVRLGRDAGIRDAVNQVGGLVSGNAEIAGMIGGERLFPYWFSFPFPVVRNGISQEKDAAGVVLYLFHLLFILLPPPLGLFPWQRSQRGRRSR